MACKRNRIIELENYIKCLGIEINIRKNKAQGNKGYFKRFRNSYRIDISNQIPADDLLSTIIHEFAHYIHYINDNKLQDLNFAFGLYNDCINQELMNITVHMIPKDYALSFFNAQDKIKQKINEYTCKLKTFFPNFLSSKPCLDIEKNFKIPLNYLLKYDRIKYRNKIYSVKNLQSDFNFLSEKEVLYINLKSEQRKLRRINKKIRLVNKYYNSSTELFARFIELYYSDYDKIVKLAPITVKAYQSTIKAGNNKLLCKLDEILTN